MNKFPSELDHHREAGPAPQLAAMRQRAAKLGSNQKLDKYAWTERQRGELLHNSGRTNIPPAIRIVPIKPEWLCGTFAAHPMLGFRRDRQKRSIAHGCASTLVSFGDPALKNKLDCWRADADAAPGVSSWGEAFELAHERRRAHAAGNCWLRDRPCPFSRDTLNDLGLPNRLVDELSDIHRLCPQPETHLGTG